MRVSVGLYVHIIKQYVYHMFIYLFIFYYVKQVLLLSVLHYTWLQLSLGIFMCVCGNFLLLPALLLLV